MAPGRNENDPDVQAVDQLIRSTKNELQQASDSYLVGLRSHISSLEGRIHELRRQLETFPAREAEEERLEAEVATAQQLYATLLGELQRARIAESCFDALVRCGSPAPARPRYGSSQDQHERAHS